jgi:hypothetical protein
MPADFPEKNTLDVAQIFQTFIAFGGDVTRTAVATSIDRKVVEQLAKSENWADKIREWMTLREGDPRDTQIQINRAVNYVQAHRLRSVLDMMVTHLSKMTPDQLETLLTKTSKSASEFSARPLADITKAVESCQLMTQRALGDTLGERPISEGKEGGSDIALQVLKAMNAADALGLDSVAVVRKELASPAKPMKTASAA